MRTPFTTFAALACLLAGIAGCAGKPSTDSAPGSAVPWDQVGPGWALAEYDASVVVRPAFKPGATTL